MLTCIFLLVIWRIDLHAILSSSSRRSVEWLCAAEPATLWVHVLSPCSVLTTSPAENCVSTWPVLLISVSTARRNYPASSSSTGSTMWLPSAKSSTGF